MHHYSNLLDEERDRLKALRDLKILDSSYESLFDIITRSISEICEIPIALISFIDQDLLWFKSLIGIDGLKQIPRELGFCC